MRYEGKQLRFDVQVLRGLAVLAVVIYHGFKQAMPQGFLGVDIFFVISGFLITRIILRDLEDGRFSFSAFYVRRAKRLLPAAYTTFFFTSLLAYLFLTSVQWHAFVRQLAGALSFTANVVLARQSGYFESAAETKPLLHIWSLSLEEQFYFVAPLVLWLATSRWWGATIVVALSASLALCLIAVTQSEWQNLAFYMLPTRAWELLAGSLVAWTSLHKRTSMPKIVSWISMGALSLALLVEVDTSHPRLGALVCVVATATILNGPSDWLRRNILTRTLAKLGDWSYSVYLVHWPIFSFAFLAYLGEPPVLIRGCLIVLAVILGWLQYRIVETPMRTAWQSSPRRTWGMVTIGTVALILVVTPQVVPPTRSEAFDAVFNQTRGIADCESESEDRLISPTCQTSPAAEVAVWGDSNAMHLVPGLMSEPVIAQSMVQVTRSECAPLPGFLQKKNNKTDDWSYQCRDFNNRALQSISNNNAIKAVVIGSAFIPLQRPALPLRKKNILPGTDSLKGAINGLRAAGKEVILIAPLPWVKFNPGECNLRQMEGVTLYGIPSCNFSSSQFTPEYRQIVYFLRMISNETGAKLFLPEDVLCQSDVCITAVAGRLIYRDNGHLSAWGSNYVMNKGAVTEYLRRLLSGGDK